MSRTRYVYLILLLVPFLVFSCSKKTETKFELVPSSKTNIHFSNDVENTPEFNIQNYLYFYDGGGVAVGDINNNGLPDLFFVGNEVEDIFGEAEIRTELFPVKAIHTEDLTNNGILDIIIAGNLFGVKPSMGGRQGAGFGLVLIGDGTGNFEPIHFRNSGFLVKGEARSIKPLQIGNGINHLIVARNNDTTLLFKLNSDEQVLLNKNE